MLKLLDTETHRALAMLLQMMKRKSLFIHLRFTEHPPCASFWVRTFSRHDRDTEMEDSLYLLFA